MISDITHKLISPVLDVDECVESNGSCLDACENVEGSYVCSCSVGYTLAADLRSCVDDDECAIDGRNSCQDNEACVNSVGSYVCMTGELILTTQHFQHVCRSQAFASQ